MIQIHEGNEVWFVNESKLVQGQVNRVYVDFDSCTARLMVKYNRELVDLPASSIHSVIGPGETKYSKAHV